MGQALHVTRDLHGLGADQAASLQGLARRAAIEQGADHTDREAVACADGIDHLATGMPGTLKACSSPPRRPR